MVVTGVGIACAPAGGNGMRATCLQIHELASYIRENRAVIPSTATVRAWNPGGAAQLRHRKTGPYLIPISVHCGELIIIYKSIAHKMIRAALEGIFGTEA